MNVPGLDSAPSTEHLLTGLDGGNPLAFLAALGTLRTLTRAWPDHRVRLSWRASGTWRPVLHLNQAVTRNEILDTLDNQLQLMRDHEAFTCLGPNLTVPPEKFRDFCARPAARCALDLNSSDRTWADFAAAFGCEATITNSGFIQDTALRTMSGAGHQHFLQFMVLIVERTKLEHLEKTLFWPWRYDDPVEKQTLRWDPADDVRRAFRWRDPSGDPQRRRRGGMLGANRLAIEGLPLLPTMPVGGELRTTGFAYRRGEGTGWTWPIWSGALTLDVTRSTLAMEDLQQESRIKSLSERGIVAVFRSRRLTIGKFRVFTPAQPI